MKKLNSNGFTLIELLAVVTIMGILLLVAIPAVSRTIENTRRDTFASNAKEYVSAVRNGFLADNIECDTDLTANDNYVVASALPQGTYYYPIATSVDTSKNYTAARVTSTTDLLESGGKSSFGNAEMHGYVKIDKTVDSNGKVTMKYSVNLVDTGAHGIGTDTEENSVKRASVSTSGVSSATIDATWVTCRLS